jgi:hypothetical protein
MMTTFETYSLWIGASGVVVGLLAAFAAIGQLRNLADAAEKSAEANQKAAEANEKSAEANRLSVLANVIDIENTMHERRKDLSAIDREVAALSKVSNPDPDDVSALSRRHKEAQESYLNAVDRLCATILRGLIPEEEAKRDYRDFVKDILNIESFKPLFHSGTPYRNITHLHEKWSPAG